MSRTLPLLLAAVLSSGCMSVNAFQRSGTLGEGTLAVAAATGVDVVEGRPSPLPVLTVGVAYGLTDRLDVGARLGGSGLEALARAQVLRSPRLALALTPGVALTPKGTVAATVGAPMSYRNPTGELVLSPLLYWENRDGTGDPILGVGGSLGYAWRVQDRLLVHLEVRALHAVQSSFWFAYDAYYGDLVTGGVAFQLLP